MDKIKFFVGFILLFFITGTFIPNSSQPDYSLEISKGNIQGASLERKFGANPSIGTTEEDLWANGGTYSWPTTCETVRIKSGGNVNDTAAGTGARSVFVFGLGDDWTLVSASGEELATAGASASSATSSCYRRVFRAYVGDAGTYTGSNTGAMVIENTTSAQVLANIAAGVGQSQLTMYTVPSGKTAYLHRIFANVSGNKPVTLYFWQRQNADDVSSPFQGKRLVRPIYSTEGPQEYGVSFAAFPEKTDLWWSGAADSGTSAADVGYDLTLVDN